MKLKEGNLFVLFSTIALLLLLVIQIYWIFQAAQIKEQLFNEKANLVLSKTIEALSADKQACASIGECIDNESATEVTSKLAKGDIKKIDSLLNHYMQFYHIHIDYTFNIGRQHQLNSLIEKSFAKSIYMMPLEDISKKKGVEIKLIFPEKKHFIMAEMGLPFITSIILIVTMIFIFWRTSVSLIKEKNIAIHTTDFLNNMSHEFKTPLSNIALAAKMVIKQSQGKDQEKLNHYTSIILEENDKLSQQIDLVLNLNAWERNEISLNKSELDFHELIHGAIKAMTMQIENADSKIDLALHATHANILGDKQQLASVVRNLIDNAIKYSNGKLILKIKTSNVNQKLMIEVADNGIGIAPEFQKKVFAKYFRVPNNDIHQVKGFGLGLAYIQRMIDLHLGEIRLISKQGIGTTFIITLPYVK